MSKKRPKAGRPPLDNKSPSRNVTVRFPTSAYREMVRRARAAGFVKDGRVNVSAYLRSVA